MAYKVVAVREYKGMGWVDYGVREGVPGRSGKGFFSWVRDSLKFRFHDS